MDMKIKFLKSAIASQQITFVLQTALAALLFVLGITVVILSFVESSPDSRGNLENRRDAGRHNRRRLRVHSHFPQSP